MAARKTHPPVRLIPEVRITMFALWAEGWYDREIAHKVHVSPKTVMRWRHANGFPKVERNH